MRIAFRSNTAVRTIFTAILVLIVAVSSATTGNCQEASPAGSTEADQQTNATLPSDRKSKDWTSMWRNVERNFDRVVDYQCRIHVDMKVFPKNGVVNTHRIRFAEGHSDLEIDFSRFGNYLSFRQFDDQGTLKAALWQYEERRYWYSSKDNRIRKERSKFVPIFSQPVYDWYLDIIDPFAIGYGFLGDHLLARDYKRIISNHLEMKDFAIAVESPKPLIQFRFDRQKIAFDLDSGGMIVDYECNLHAVDSAVTQDRWETKYGRLSDDVYLPISSSLIGTYNQRRVYERHYAIDWQNVNKSQTVGFEPMRDFANKRGISIEE